MLEQNGFVSPKRNLISSLFALGKRHIYDVCEDIIQTKIFKVKIDGERNYFLYFQKVQDTLSAISQKLSSIKVDVPQTNLTLQVPADDRLKELTNEVKQFSTSSSGGFVELKNTISSVISNLQFLSKQLGILKLEVPKIQKIYGKVEVSSIPSLYDFDKIVNELYRVRQTISNIKLEVPKSRDIKIPDFPKELNIQEGERILSALDRLNKSIDALPKKYPEINIPRTISVDNFPPQKYPMPVTHISINSLKGYVKTRSITITTSLTPLPDEVLAYRRSLVIYNNSSVTIFIGGSDVTTSNGMPVPASSYSPALDAGPDMILYAVVSTGTANVRVMELSDENSGR